MELHISYEIPWLPEGHTSKHRTHHSHAAQPLHQLNLHTFLTVVYAHRHLSPLHLNLIRQWLKSAHMFLIKNEESTGISLTWGSVKNTHHVPEHNSSTFQLMSSPTVDNYQRIRYINQQLHFDKFLTFILSQVNTQSLSWTLNCDRLLHLLHMPMDKSTSPGHHQAHGRQQVTVGLRTDGRTMLIALHGTVRQRCEELWAQSEGKCWNGTKMQHSSLKMSVLMCPVCICHPICYVTLKLRHATLLGTCLWFSIF